MSETTPPQASTPTPTTSDQTTDTPTNTEESPSKVSPTPYFQTYTYDCSALPQGWKRQVQSHQNCAASIRGKRQTTAYVFKGERYTTKYQLARAFSKITKNENGVDLSSFDWKNGRWIRQHHKQKKGLEQLSTELFGKGITDINFTISQPTELQKKGLPADKSIKLLEQHGEGSETKQDMPRPTDIPDWDFNYEADQGINGTPVHHPTKKRQKQAHPISSHGPLQLYGVKRLAGPHMKPCYRDGGTPIKQPKLPPGMDESVVESKIDYKTAKNEVIKMESHEIEVPAEAPPDFSVALNDDTLWRQTVLSLTIDGKALPSTAIWGQRENQDKRLAREPDCWLDHTQPFVKHFSISKEVIAKQASRVRELRKELATLFTDLNLLERQKLCEELGVPFEPEDDGAVVPNGDVPNGVSKSDDVMVID